MTFATVEDFERAYAESHHRSVEELHVDGMFGYRALYCSLEGCDGWHMGTESSREEERALARLIDQ